ncbi:hypothetical protein IKF20_01905 [Candidatus Saccharibacteria bacterium]|nr:hypothetical protein [Candidatus Saccharibacteria bacterium]
MNKRYIDFVPTKKKGAQTVQPAKQVTARPTKQLAKEDSSQSVNQVSNQPVRRPVGQSVRRAASRSVRQPVNQNVKQAAPVRRANTQARTVRAEVPRASATRVATMRTLTTSRTEINESMPRAAMSSAKLKEVSALDEIENLNKRFVETNVPKRSLDSRNRSEEALLKAKAKRIKAGSALRSMGGVNATDRVNPVEKPVEKSMKMGASSAFKPPVTPFINSEKIVKRPLSKNVYQKQTVKKNIKTVEPKGPVTIIAKPEKDAHVSIVVTIIITIILGAAAGTVAFLLLPK